MMFSCFPPTQLSTNDVLPRIFFACLPKAITSCYKLRRSVVRGNALLAVKTHVRFAILPVSRVSSCKMKLQMECRRKESGRKMDSVVKCDILIKNTSGIMVTMDFCVSEFFIVKMETPGWMLKTRYFNHYSSSESFE